MITISYFISFIIVSAVWFIWSSFKKKTKSSFKNIHLDVDPNDYAYQYISILELACNKMNIKMLPVLYPNIHLICCDNPHQATAAYYSFSDSTKRILEDEKIFFINEKNSPEPTKSIYEIFNSVNFEVSNFELYSFILQDKTITIVFALGQHELIVNSFGILIRVDNSFL